MATARKTPLADDGENTPDTASTDSLVAAAVPGEAKAPVKRAPRKAAAASTTASTTAKKATAKTAASGTTKKAPSKTAASGAKKTTTRKSTSKTAARPTKARGKNARLIIVESPTKARTIERYLGGKYRVQASMGHVRDLPKSTMGVDIEGDFTPKYTVPRDKSKAVRELREMVQAASEVILATDPDREGEAIAWHLVEATQPSPGSVKRVVFNEITPSAVQEAMLNPREIDMNLVDAQQARRVLDRLVGYSISPLLWRKVKRGLSAGRVQSVALRLVAEREREILAFNAVEYWSVAADLKKRNAPPKTLDAFTAELRSVNGVVDKFQLGTGESAHEVVTALEGAEFMVADVQKRQTQRRPAAPFTTSTLQQEASRKLRFPVGRTMQIAQQLYEGVDLGVDGTQGLITYMRTDSTNVSTTAQDSAKVVIAGQYGAEYVPEKPPVYTRRSKGAQEAHEAIRPADPARTPESLSKVLSRQQLQLYRLIWQRFIASQMRNAMLDGTTIDIDAGPVNQPKPYRFRATGSIITFRGFLAVYEEGKDDEADDEKVSGLLPIVEVGEVVDLTDLRPDQHFTQPPPRFTEASLVKALEEHGIGRPSTYAPTIYTLRDRNYVAVEERRLVPTELGFVVNDIMVEHFPNVVDMGFTSQLEEELDDVASGERGWVPLMREFWGPFDESIKRAETTMERVKIADEPTDEVCEKCGRPMVIKLGRYGRFIACTGFPECRNARPLLVKIGVTCPTCAVGDVVERRSSKGRVFFGCSRYPECDFVIWSKPTGERCPRCNQLLILAGRGGSEIRCSSCDYRRENTAESEAIPA